MENASRGVNTCASLENIRATDASVGGERSQWGKLQNADSAAHTARYREWIEALRKGGLLPLERLLPTVAIPACGAVPPVMRRASARPLDAVTLAELRAHKWGYYFDFGEGTSTVNETSPEETNPQRDSRQRMLYRMNAIDGAIAALYGGDLAGKRVLDLACNHGAFALDLLVRGAAYARGVDIRPENIEKAKLLARHLEIENAEFVQGDVYDEPESKHEIVLCLGLLYHVTKPYELVELCYRLCTEMVV